MLSVNLHHLYEYYSIRLKRVINFNYRGITVTLAPIPAVLPPLSYPYRSITAVFFPVTVVITAVTAVFPQ